MTSKESTAEEVHAYLQTLEGTTLLFVYIQDAFAPTILHYHGRMRIVHIHPELIDVPDVKDLNEFPTECHGITLQSFSLPLSQLAHWIDPCMSQGQQKHLSDEEGVDDAVDGLLRRPIMEVTAPTHRFGPDPAKAEGRVEIHNGHLLDVGKHEQDFQRRKLQDWRDME